MRGRWSVLLLGLVLVSVSCQYVEKEREIGYKGLARVDQFLALRRLAEKLGMKATSYARLPEFPLPDGTTLVAPAGSLRGEGMLYEVQNWVYKGGNLVVFLSLGERLQFDGEQEPDFKAFLDYFDYDYEISGDFSRATSGEDRSRSWKSLNFPYADHMEKEYRIDFQPPVLIKYRGGEDDEEGYEELPIYTYDYGQGVLTVMATAHPFTNREIGKQEHASLIWDLLRATEDDEVWFITSTKLSFFGMLWDAAATALICLAVFVVALIWWAAKGFGPRYRLEDRTTAKLDEHLQASGTFFLKHKADRLILAAQRGELLKRLARRVNLPFNAEAQEILKEAQKVEVIMPNETVALGMDSPDTIDLNYLQTLQNLDKRL